MFNTSATSHALSSVWTRPSGVFALLLLAGGDIVSSALAQLTGGYVAPVAFSFGWVAYTFSALASIGNGRLMPAYPDSHCTVIDGNSGFVTENKSWILGRIMRDYERWMDPAVRDKLRRMKGEHSQEHKPSLSRRWPITGHIKLCVSVYEPDFTLRAGLPLRDMTFYTGFWTIFLQLGVASIPLGLYGDWSVILVTAIGSILALLTTALPRWRQEKFDARRNSKKSVILSDGRRHMIIIIGTGRGLDFQDLARGILVPPTLFTKYSVLALAVSWVALLITALNDTVGTWFLLAVGAIGMLHNFHAGSVARNPSAFGIHLRYKDVIGREKVMETLYEVEERFPRLGKSILPTVVYGELRKDEIAKWEYLAKRAREEEKGPPLSDRPPLVLSSANVSGVLQTV